MRHRISTILPLAALAALVLNAAAQQRDAWADRPTQKPDEANIKKIEEALPAAATAKPKMARRILVFWRCDGHFHGGGIAGANEAIRLMGEKTGAYTADFSAVYAAFAAENLVKYDAVVLNSTTRLNPSPEQRQALIEFVRGGKGLVGIHGASDNFYEWPEGAKMIGGLFDGHPWGADGTWAVKIETPGHPLTKAFGGEGFKIRDEIYQLKDPYTRADRRVLLSVDLADPVTANTARFGNRADKDYAIAWIRREGKGRVFYNSLGHEVNVFQVPAVLKFNLDGIQYALGDLPADDSPASK
jgi:hypothetical protein